MIFPDLSIAAPNQRPAGEASTPAPHSTVLDRTRWPPATTPPASTLVTWRVRVNLHAQALEMTLRLRRQIFGKCRKHARCRLVQEDLRLARIDVTKVMRQRHPRHLCQGARHFHAHRARADQHEGEQLPYSL